MSKRTFFARYNLIINKLRRKPSDYNEIVDYLTREFEIQGVDFKISKRTFKRDLEDIFELFNICIEYDFSRKVYFIDDGGQPDTNDRILEAFDTFQALKLSDGLSSYMHFEKRKPAGTESLYGLLHAIKSNFQIIFNYHKFWEDKITQRIVEPLAVKEFRNRWYVIAKDLKDNRIKSFGLDRLTDLDITRRTFKYPKDYNMEMKYRYCFGIISSDNDPQEIVLSFTAIQGKYIKTLPLHTSQSIIIDNEVELQVQLKLCITHDFIMELLSFGNNVKVIKPNSLAETIKEEHRKAFFQY